MNPHNPIRAIALGLILATLGVYATSSSSSAQTLDQNGPGGESWCAWILIVPPILTPPITPITDLFLSALIDSAPKAVEDVNEPCEPAKGLTPLQAASAMLDDGGLPAIRLLLQHNADVSLAVSADASVVEEHPHYADATALHIAADGGQRIATLEMIYGSAIAEEFAKADGLQRTATLETLIGSGADIAARTNAGATPLHLAAAKGDFDMVELLLERGSDVQARDERGWTPLHYAADQSEHEEVVTALVELGGADIEATTNSGQTAHELILDNQKLQDSEAAYLLEIW